MDETQLQEIEVEEEQLKQAIALSLQDQSIIPPKANFETSSYPAKEVIDLSSDDDLMSPSRLQHHDNTAVTTSAMAGTGLLGLDRKAMEEERLARKRKAPISPPAPRKDRSVTSSNSKLAISKEKERKASYNSKSNPGERGVLHEQVPGVDTIKEKTTPLLFPNGAVRKTWAFGHARNEDIKIEEVLERNDLTLAMLSSFQWDVEWLLGKINVGSTKMIFVMQAKEESIKRQYERETADMPNLRFCFPSMEGQINCMHSKLMLLAHPTYLRVVVPTANLVPYDWGESGVMENMVFLIDLPRLPEGDTTSPDKMTFFGQELVYFLQAMDLQKEVIQSIYNFDFSATTHLAFVHTTGGTHFREAEGWRRTGYCGLGRAVNQLRLGADEQVQVDFVTSSIGALNLEFLTRLYLATQGDNGLAEYERRTNPSTKGKSKVNTEKTGVSAQADVVKDVEKNFRIYFPTHDTVAMSRGGVDAGGTVCFQPKWYNAPTFPRHLLRDCTSRREGMLMHNKVSESSRI